MKQNGIARELAGEEQMEYFCWKFLATKVFHLLFTSNLSSSTILLHKFQSLIYEKLTFVSIQSHYINSFKIRPASLETGVLDIEPEERKELKNFEEEEGQWGDMERPKRPRFSFPYFSGSSSSSHCDKDAGRFIRKMVLSLKGEAARSEDMFAHIEEILISVRLAFLNCFLEFAAHLEQIGADLSQGTSKPDHQEPFINAPESVLDAHRKLLMVLSNIGYCKDELASEHYNKYKYIWLQSRGNDEDSSDLQDLIMSVSGLGGKMLECLVHTFLSLLEENRYDDLSLIANGFSQLMLELEYLETRLDPYLTHDATESLKSLQAAVLKKAPFSIFSSVDTFTKFEEDKESIDMRYDHPEGFVKLQTSPLNLLLQCNGR